MLLVKVTSGQFRGSEEPHVAPEPWVADPRYSTITELLVWNTDLELKL